MYDFVWDIMPCIPLKANRRFRGTCHLNFQDRKTNQATSAFYLLYYDFLFGLFFDTEDEGKMFLRNVS
jgi:hypothetical protein